jgi:PAS domain S-box-containing protein
VLAIAIPIWLVVLILGDGFIFVRKVGPTVLILANLCSAALSYYVARRGHVRVGVWTLLAASWIEVTIATWLAGGLSSPIPVYYVVLTAGAGWMLDRQASTFVAGISCAALAVMVAVDNIGPGLPRYFPVPPLAALLVFGVAITLFTVPLIKVLESVHRTQERLQESELQARTRAAQLQATMDAAPAAIFIAHDAECRYISGNRKAYDLLRQQPGGNLSKSAPAGEAPTNFRVMRDGVEISSEALPIQQVARTGLPMGNCELQMVFEDGACVELLANAEPLLDDEGSPRGAVGVMSDITEHKRAEAALREGEERFRNMADTAPVMIWVSGPDKRCTFFNKAWLDFRGRTLEQELGQGWVEGVHPEDLARCSAMYSSAFDSRRAFQKECRLRRADGEYRWLLDNGTPTYREGEFTGYIGSSIDITERKEIEEQLRADEARLLDSQRLAKVGSWELDDETGGLYWSDEMFRIFGVPRDVQPDFDLFLSFVYPNDLQIIAESRATVAVSPTPVNMEFRIVRRDGSVRFIRSIVQALKNDLGALLGFSGAAQDITEQILAGQHLRESEARLRNAERIAHVGNWAWDAKTNQVTWSEELFRIHGQPADFKLGYEGIRESVAPQDRDRVGQWVRDCLAEKRGSSIEYRIARPNGDLRTVICTAEVVLDEEAMPVRLIGTCQDVTDVRREQDEAFARQKLESVGTLAGGIAHDFNNLLGAVLAQAEWALMELQAGSTPEAELERIKEVAIRGSEIVRQLMIYAGTEGETVGPVDLSRTVDEMVELLKISVSKHAMLLTDLAGDLPALQANAAQIRRLVMNLVTNASQAIGDRDGVIRVATRHVAAACNVALSKSATAGDYIELEVSDNGCGMSQEIQSKVFDPFFTTNSEGHGLGLAVVQGIVRNLGGTIHLTSEPDKGTTFQILLPCVRSVAEKTADPLCGSRGTTRESLAGNVLIVEDEEVLRQAEVKVLRRAGAEVLEAADGSTAIDLLREHSGDIDVILLDLTIPGASAPEVLAEAAQARPKSKVLLTSAYSEEKTASMRGPMIRGFIRKPFRLGDLVQTLRNVLPS